MRKIVTLVCLIGIFVVVPTALAGNSTVLTSYGSNGVKSVIKVKGATTTKATTPSPAATGTLPFTGSDLTLFVAGGVLLVGLGIGLRRMRPDDN